MLFQWNSADHVPYSQSEQPLPASAEHAVGLVPHQRRPDRHRRQPADRRPRHLDDLQGRPPDGPDPVAARRQGQQLQARKRPRASARRCGRDLRLAARSRSARARRVHVLRQRVGRRRPELPVQPGGHGQARREGQRRDARRRPMISPRACRPHPRATPKRPPGGTSSSAGESCPTSPSSTRPGTCSSTPSSRPASTRTAPTCCRGIRSAPADPPRHR